LTRLSEAEEKIEEMIRQFFENEYISIRNVDRFVAERARPLVRKCGVKPADAVQLATAILVDAHVMETYDSKLLKLSGLDEITGLRVQEPHL
jgi:predicted nucleic acid-binding protein